MGDRLINCLLLGTLILFGGLVFFFGGGLGFTVCPFKAVTGIPCPGCGGIRSTVALLHGDLCGAFAYNALSPFVALFLFSATFWLVADIIRGKRTLLDLLNRKWGRAAVITVIALIAANWIWNIFRHFSCGA